MKKKRTNKTNQRRATFEKNKYFYFGIGGILLIMITAFIAVSIRNPTTDLTGAPVYIKNHGVSDYPLEAQAGKIQTVIELTQPTLEGLGEPQGNVNKLVVANQIIEATDFTNDITTLYRRNPAASILDNEIDLVTKGAETAIANFRENTDCLKKIGSNYGHWGSIKIILTTELVYQGCNKNKDWKFAYTKHTFINQEGNLFICSQESDKLFLIRDVRGTISLDTTNC